MKLKTHKQFKSEPMKDPGLRHDDLDVEFKITGIIKKAQKNLHKKHLPKKSVLRNPRLRV